MILYSNSRPMSLGITVAVFTLATLAGCSIASPPSTPARADKVITNADTAVLDANHHLALDLRVDTYEIETSLGSVELTYVDIIDLAGRVQPIEQLLSSSEATGLVTRKDFAAGFSVSASGDQVVLNGHVNDGLRRIRCFACACDDSTNPPRCECVEVGCGRPFAPEQR